MKTSPVIFLLVIAVVAATLLHAAKIKGETDDIDRTASGLRGIEKVLPTNAHITIQMLGVPDYTWLYCRYLLVPRYCDYYRPGQTEKIDTLIAITNVNATDSLVRTITSNRKLIWEGSDPQAKYYLTCNSR